MKIIISYLFIILFINTSLFSDTTIGITLYDNNNKSSSDIRKIKRVVSEVFDDINKRSEEKINLLFLDTKETILKEFEAFKKFDILISYSSFYLENKDSLKKIGKNPFVLSREGKQKTQMILIANKKSNIKSLKDIKNKTYVSYMDSTQANIWLDYKSRKIFNKSYKKVIEKEYSIRKNSRRVLDVYFEKVDFSVVPKDVYEDMLLLNPSLKKNISIIDKSEPIFYYMVGLYHKNIKKPEIDKFISIVNDEINNKKVTKTIQAIEAFHINTSSFEDLKEMEGFYDKYKKLVKGTGN